MRTAERALLSAPRASSVPVYWARYARAAPACREFMPFSPTPRAPAPPARHQTLMSAPRARAAQAPSARPHAGANGADKGPSPGEACGHAHGSTAQAPISPRSTPATRLTAVDHRRLVVPLGELEAPLWIGNSRANARAAETWPPSKAACGGEPVQRAQRAPRPEAESDPFTLLTQGLTRGGAAGREVTAPQDPNLRH